MMIPTEGEGLPGQRSNQWIKPEKIKYPPVTFLDDELLDAGQDKKTASVWHPI